MLTRLPGSRRTSGATEKLSPTAYPGVGYGSWPTISTRTPANGSLNARSTFSPAGRYRRPAATSARRKSPIAAIRPATGSSASAQPGSIMLRNGSAMSSYFSLKIKTFIRNGAWLTSSVHRSASHRGHAASRFPGPGRMPAAGGDGAGQPARVAGRGAVLVVVEVDVDVTVAGPGGGEPFRPRAQRALAVAGPRGAVALVQPQVPPPGRAPQRGDRGPGAVRPAQRRAGGRQHVPDLVGPPGFVPE